FIQMTATDLNPLNRIRRNAGGLPYDLPVKVKVSIAPLAPGDRPAVPLLFTGARGIEPVLAALIGFGPVKQPRIRALFVAIEPEDFVIFAVEAPELLKAAFSAIPMGAGQPFDPEGNRPLLGGNVAFSRISNGLALFAG